MENVVTESSVTMIVLRDNEYVMRVENHAALHGERLGLGGFADNLFDEACEAAFGVRYADLPKTFLDTPQSWDNWHELRRWAAQRGYDVMDSLGVPLRYADYFGYVIEALDLGVVQPDQHLKDRYAKESWGTKLESAAAEFTKLKRRGSQPRA
ncbi:hypothetical protein [Maricaulis salignorans]|uniref:hypothetical protein n=1 Tax=Maricaulis salignorans TaxID=144026 RepID=UPI003A905098